ncbi:hypothetical protein GGU11DRAFT_360118 [Lentinula aff. detonsa]|nr:hypothetical protein GGU11DRAFT_360118 [Lentinula aff. detonsa]
MFLPTHKRDDDTLWTRCVWAVSVHCGQTTHKPHFFLHKVFMASINVHSERFLADRAAPLCSLDISKTFAQLSSKEKKYTHYVSEAAWAGARIIQAQWTPEANELYDLLILTFSDDGHLADLETLRSASGLTPNEWEDIEQYTIQVLSNLVNYRSFGFTKIIPRGGSRIKSSKLLCRNLQTRKTALRWETMMMTDRGVLACSV